MIIFSLKFYSHKLKSSFVTEGRLLDKVYGLTLEHRNAYQLDIAQELNRTLNDTKAHLLTWIKLANRLIGITKSLRDVKLVRMSGQVIRDKWNLCLWMGCRDFQVLRFYRNKYFYGFKQIFCLSKYNSKTHFFNNQNNPHWPNTSK